LSEASCRSLRHVRRRYTMHTVMRIIAVILRLIRYGAPDACFMMMHAAQAL